MKNQKRRFNCSQRSYAHISDYEKSKLEKGYKRIKTYEEFYLYGKYDGSGNLLYRECFSKFDIDGPKKAPKPERDPLAKYNRYR